MEFKYFQRITERDIIIIIIIIIIVIIIILLLIIKHINNIY